MSRDYQMTWDPAIVVPKSYSTTFSATENPLSESGAWAAVQDRTVFRSSGGVAFGTQVGGGFDDSIMALTGSWGPDCEIITTVFKGSSSGIQEVEHNHRIDAAVGRYYEITFAHDGQYCDFVRAEGGILLANYTYLVPTLTYSVPGGAINNGDRLRTRIVGDAINAWIDRGSGWVLINSSPVTDTSTSGHAKWAAGKPGMGGFKTSGSGAMSAFCFTDYQATQL